MQLFGIYSITHHGWSKVLTVMSDQGRRAALEAIQSGEGIEVRTGEGRLTQYHGLTTSHLERLVERHGIILMTPQDWSAKKAELGQSIFD